MAKIDDLLNILKGSNKGNYKVPIFPNIRRSKSEYDLDMIRLAFDFA